MKRGRVKRGKGKKEGNGIGLICNAMRVARRLPSNRREKESWGREKSCTPREKKKKGRGERGEMMVLSGPI